MKASSNFLYDSEQMSRKTNFDSDRAEESYFLRTEINQRKFRYLILLTATYSFVALIVMVFIYNKDLLFFPFVDTKTSKELRQEIVSLKSNEDEINSRLDQVEKGLSSDPRDKDLQKISAQIQDLKAQQQAINQTITVDSDKALTATLLREKQKEIDANISDTRANQNRLNDKVDQFISTIISVPLIGFVLALLSYLIYFLINRYQSGKEQKKDISDLVGV